MSNNSTKTKKSDCDDFNVTDRIGSKFLQESTYFLTGEIEHDNINECIKWIVYENLNASDTDKTLTLYINSQGGDVYEAFGLIDVMRSSTLPIRTVGYGSVMSAGFMIFTCGKERYIAPNAGIMCHQFSSIEDVGKYHDIKATRKETDRVNKAMMDLLKTNTGLDGRVVKNKLLPAHDVYLTAEEMINLGAADYILDTL
jgi:ATP-dependent Clp protease protease subunit